MNKNIVKATLSNGLTILIHRVTTIPKVSLQLWYGVGSKHEKDGERGLAHLLEHMTFKGTKKLSESDIKIITHQTSGYCNAFTSHDYTCYLFDMPRQHWPMALEMLSDCMTNCTFKNDLLQSEVKAVIQELKMYQDNYVVSLSEHLLASIFTKHPYHYPIIGYRHDLWNITRDSLASFYKKHYVPNNATLVVVGDVNPDEVIEKAKALFGSFDANSSYHRKTFPMATDLAATSVTLYREVQQPIFTYAFVVPGLSAQKDYLIDAASWVLADGRGSRLYKKLVQELQLVTDIETSLYDLCDSSVLFIYVSPVKSGIQRKIRDIIKKELEALIAQPISKEELNRAIAQVDMDYLNSFENIATIAHGIGRAYLATENENSFFDYARGIDQENLGASLQQFFARYCNPILMHEGALLPLSDEEKKRWHAMQDAIDKEDLGHGAQKNRMSTVEDAVYAHTITVADPEPFLFPQAKRTVINNGLALLWHANERSDKIDILLSLKAKHFYDDRNHEGIGAFVAEMLAEGTERWPAEQLANILEQRGISLSVQPGYIGMSLRAADLAFALEVLLQVFTAATFESSAIEKVREQMFSDIDAFWDSPAEFSGQLAKQVVYHNHPYSLNVLGTRESIARITQEDLHTYYKKYYSPEGASLAIVGAVSAYDIPALVQKTIGSWQGSVIVPPSFPTLTPIVAREVTYPIGRDQSILVLTGLSVDRHSEDFDALFLFDQLLTGGVLNSMNSHLFNLREQTGLFYSIGGSIIAHADEQPGIVLIKAIVSPDQAKKAEALIKDTLKNCTDLISEQTLRDARNAITSSLVDSFESNLSMAHMFLFLERFGYSSDYLTSRSEQLKKITPQHIRQAVHKVLDLKHLATLHVGRV